jgi:AcrR family transcriptional regulator
MSEIAAPERGRHRRRADAERSIAAILDAAVDLLAERPAASMREIAASARVARQTVYAHFDSREALLTAVAERALTESLAAIDSTEPQHGPAVDALARLLPVWWGTIARHARVLEALATAYPSAEAVHELHSSILERLERLVRRGQRAGDFDRRVSAGWLAAAFLGLMHVAADEVAAGRIDSDGAARALERSVPRMFGVDGPT